MRVAFVGAGAMGCLFGAGLKLVRNEVLLVDHNAGTVAEIEKSGVRLRQLDGTSSRVRVPIEQAPANLREFEVVFFTVKAYSTQEAARQHRKRVGPKVTILTLQNGLGNVETLTRHFGARHVVAGSTTEASLLLGPGLVTHTGRGKTLLGELDGSRSRRCSNIVSLFRDAGFESALTRNANGIVWAKAIVNSAINPISALTRLRNGQLAGVNALKRIMLRTLEEGVRVSFAEHVRLEPRNPAHLLFQILRATAANQSSMLQDVVKGRRTEIKQLNGMIVEGGLRNGIPTPYNGILTSLVLGLERSKLRTTSSETTTSN